MVLSLPFVQRDLFLRRALSYQPKAVDTLFVEWDGIRIEFGSSEVISSAQVWVHPGTASLAQMNQAFERLIDCYAPGEGGECVLKYTFSTQGICPGAVQLNMFDRISKLDSHTGETVGTFKRKRKSILLGYGTLRFRPNQKQLQVVLRHPSAQGVKALWKSCECRLERLKNVYEFDQEEE